MHTNLKTFYWLSLYIWKDLVDLNLMIQCCEVPEKVQLFWCGVMGKEIIIWALMRTQYIWWLPDYYGHKIYIYIYIYIYMPSE